MRPVTTGLMLKGRSRTASSNVLPGKLLRAMSSAALMPNSVLMGTATAASASVSCSCRVCAEAGSGRGACVVTCFRAYMQHARLSARRNSPVAPHPTAQKSVGAPSAQLVYCSLSKSHAPHEGSLGPSCVAKMDRSRWQTPAHGQIRQLEGRTPLRMQLLILAPDDEEQLLERSMHARQPT